jgi:uncharacterized protein YjbJ (UPF0337 family)
VNWCRIAGGWKQLKSRARQRWGRRTADDRAATATQEASRKQLAEWAAGQHDVDPIHK